ncbi:uncharacterized protein LOC134467554 [Engraulis encrasicolus]|uniref:uncharacterized protein LOC134467554 n=1 Tax=Engraulis encrasicolus TaxID=184585 RepID=UPI002FD5A59C
MFVIHTILQAVGGAEADPLIDEMPVEMSTPGKDPGYSSYHDVGMPLVLTTPEGAPKSRKSLSGIYLAYPAIGEKSTSASEELHTEMAVLDTSMTSAFSDDERDMTFSLSSQKSTTSTASSSLSSPLETQSDWDERKWIVNESHLMKLFRTCHKCGVAIAEKKVIRLGSQIKVEWTCLNSHSERWTSCPDAQGMGQNNLLIPAAVLFTGTTFTEINQWARMLNLQLPKKTQFYDVQKKYLFPVIHKAYEEQQQNLIQQVMQLKADGNAIELSGDARSDSPGHSSKYSTYSFQLLSTNEIIHFELLQVTEASSSVAMEPQGFRRGLNGLLYTEGLSIDLIATDRSPSIRKIMREEFPQIRHEFDPWHVAKGILKKLMPLANKKDNRLLQGWIRSILNHFWFCCSTCEGSAEQLVQRWTSLLHHICGEHEWEEDGVKRRCYHAPLSLDDQLRRDWLQPESQVFKALQAIVEDKRLLKDLQQLTHFKHTGALEVFHSAMLNYLPKRLHFQYESMVARTKLAVMDNNFNVGREQAVTAEGAPRFSQEFKKHSKDWIVRKIYEPTSQAFTTALIEDVLERREKKEASEDQTHFKRPQNIASKPKPPKEDAIKKHQSRFQKD